MQVLAFLVKNVLVYKFDVSLFWFEGLYEHSTLESNRDLQRSREWCPEG